MQIQSKQEQRKENVIRAAQMLFSNKGIENTSIQDIADHAEIGVASVYRYFGNKSTIAVSAAISLWSNWNKEIEKLTFEGETGLEQIDEFISAVIDFFKAHPDFLRFIDQFDTYISSMEEPPAGMLKYQEVINYMQPLILKIITKGLGDGSVRSDLELEETFSTIMHSILCLAQKLFLRGNIIPQDLKIKPEVELTILKKMILQYISN